MEFVCPLKLKKYTLYKTMKMWLWDLRHRSTIHYTITLALSAMIICTIFIPFQGVDAVKVELANQNIQTGSHTTVDLKITLKTHPPFHFQGG